MSRHDNWEAEDGMGFAGLVPTLAEKRREQEEERERELIAALRESLASAQRGKEAAERELEEVKNQLQEHLYLAISRGDALVRLQHERDRLAARLDAAEKLIPQWRASASTALSGRALNMCANELEIAISSSPSTSAVAGEAKCRNVMVGSGTDAYDPLCELPKGHSDFCKSSAATDQHKL